MKKIVYLLYFVQINNGTYFFTFRGILPKKVCWRLKRIILNIFLVVVLFFFFNLFFFLNFKILNSYMRSQT